MEDIRQANAGPHNKQVDCSACPHLLGHMTLFLLIYIISGDPDGSHMPEGVTLEILRTPCYIWLPMR